MSAMVEQLKAQLGGLSCQERAELALFLLTSLEPEEDEATVSQEDTCDTALEYGVYGLPRSGSKIVGLSDSFRAFIEGVLSGSVSVQMGYDFQLTAEERNEFIPYVELPAQEASNSNR